jgi:hypothetical protein
MQTKAADTEIDCSNFRFFSESTVRIGLFKCNFYFCVPNIPFLKAWIYSMHISSRASNASVA